MVSPSLHSFRRFYKESIFLPFPTLKTSILWLMILSSPFKTISVAFWKFLSFFLWPLLQSPHFLSDSNNAASYMPLIRTPVFTLSPPEKARIISLISVVNHIYLICFILKGNIITIAIDWTWTSLGGQFLCLPYPEILPLVSTQDKWKPLSIKFCIWVFIEHCSFRIAKYWKPSNVYQLVNG